MWYFYDWKIRTVAIRNGPEIFLMGMVPFILKEFIPSISLNCCLCLFFKKLITNRWAWGWGRCRKGWWDCTRFEQWVESQESLVNPQPLGTITLMSQWGWRHYLRDHITYRNNSETCCLKRMTTDLKWHKVEPVSRSVFQGLYHQ